MSDWDDDHGDWDDDVSETITCKHCGRDVYEDAPQCPGCGAYVTRSTSPFAGKPTWYVVLAVVGVIVTMLALVLA